MFLNAITTVSTGLTWATLPLCKYKADAVQAPFGGRRFFLYLRHTALKRRHGAARASMLQIRFMDLCVDSSPQRPFLETASDNAE